MPTKSKHRIANAVGLASVAKPMPEAYLNLLENKKGSGVFSIDKRAGIVA